MHKSKVIDERIFTGNAYVWFIVLTFLSLAAIANVLWHWFSLEHILAHPIVFSLLTLILLVKLLISQIRWFILPSMKRPRPMSVRTGWKVGVVTTFVPGGEALDMLERTVRSLVELDYPHETWVLDEGDDEEVKELCRRLGANHFSRKTLPQYKTQSGTFQSVSKHGNYNAWLTEIGFERYDIVTAFDPDHVPVPSFLRHVLGYFDDPQVGYVQLPQFYYNKKASFIAHGAAEEAYAYYSCSQPAAYALSHPMIIGSHNTHRVVALKEVGGFAPHAADDLLITLFYRARGWRGIYVPRMLAQGLAPVNWTDYLTQQLRWAKSVLDIKLRYDSRLAGRLPLRERFLRFLHGLSFVEGGITTFIFLLLLAIMLATDHVPGVVSFLTVGNLLLLSGVLLIGEFFRQRFYIDPRRERGIPWRAILLRYAKWPYLFWAFYKVISGDQVAYSLTPKTTTESRHYRLLWPHALVVLIISASWAIGTFTSGAKPPVIHLLAAVVVFVSLALVFTGFLRFPDPYEDVDITNGRDLIEIHDPR
jgi:cellulose synthase (UDP-forming)